MFIKEERKTRLSETDHELTSILIDSDSDNLSDDARLTVAMLGASRSEVCEVLVDKIFGAIGRVKATPNELIHVGGILIANSCQALEQRGLPREVIVQILRGMGEVFAKTYETLAQHEDMGKPKGNA